MEALNTHNFQMKSTLEEKGFVLFKDVGLVDLIDLPDGFTPLNKEERLRDNGEKDLPPEIVKKFNLAATYLKATYLQPLWMDSKFSKFIFWDGVDKDNQYWHTDVFEDMDVFFLLYFDDTHVETGGGLHFKWKGQTHFIQPKRGDLVLVSNSRGFFHKADASSIQRRVASFDFKITTAD